MSSTKYRYTLSIPIKTNTTLQVERGGGLTKEALITSITNEELADGIDWESIALYDCVTFELANRPDDCEIEEIKEVSP